MSIIPALLVVFLLSSVIAVLFTLTDKEQEEDYR